MQNVTDDRADEVDSEFSSHGLWSTLTPLLARLLSDTQALLREEVALAVAEFRQESQKARTTLRSFTVSWILGLIAVALIAQMSVYLLHAWFPVIPLWGCFGVIGAVVGVIAAILFASSGARYSSAKRPMSRTIKSLQESLSCLARNR